MGHRYITDKFQLQVYFFAWVEKSQCNFHLKHLFDNTVKSAIVKQRNKGNNFSSLPGIDIYNKRVLKYD